MDDLKHYEYGAMSSRWSLEAPNDLTAIATICNHYGRSANAVVIYEPKDLPRWAFSSSIQERMDEIFSDHGGYDKFCKEHVDGIKAAYATIERLI